VENDASSAENQALVLASENGARSFSVKGISKELF
jgi:hypothetical protein